MVYLAFSYVCIRNSFVRAEEPYVYNIGLRGEAIAVWYNGYYRDLDN
jgi:hypothetical protein